jgi:hypothetical protein
MLTVFFSNGQGRAVIEKAARAEWGIAQWVNENSLNKAVEVLFCLDGEGKPVAEFRQAEVAGFALEESAIQ